nr:YdeI/OmpD-associated family protein [Ruegeria sp. R13_0]
MDCGQSTYTVLPIPHEIAAAFKKSGAKRVEVELNDHPFNMALAKSSVISEAFVCTRKAVLRSARISPSEDIDVRLHKADPNFLEMPYDVISAVRAANLSDTWSALTPGKTRGLVLAANTAERAETRVKRIAQLISFVARVMQQMRLTIVVLSVEPSCCDNLYFFGRFERKTCLHTRIRYQLSPSCAFIHYFERKAIGG